MLTEIPQFRKQAIENWPQPFLKELDCEKFLVVIHGVPIQFCFQSEKLKTQLRDFFPKSWQLETCEVSLKVFWESPDIFENQSVEWDQIINPNCQFENQFICQRDFLAKKVSPNCYELVSQLKIDDGLFNFLRAILPCELLNQNKILFHSSCVVNSKNEAFIFFGPSGAGKTTISQLCAQEGGNVLGDDMNLLTMDDNDVWVEAAAVGQRFFDKKNFGKVFPVKRMFWLQKGPVNRLRSMAFGQKGRLLSSFANLFWDQLSLLEYERLFQLLSKADSNIEVLELEFNKTYEVWNYVQSTDI